MKHIHTVQAESAALLCTRLSIRSSIRLCALSCALLALAGLSACGEDSSASPEPGPSNITVNNDSAQLASRLTPRDEEVEVIPENPPPGAAKKALLPLLSLSADISPPVVNGVALQATSIDIQGSYVYVSYNVQGSAYVGAVDIIQLRILQPPLLKSQVTISDADVNALYFDGATMHLAEASGNAAYASPSLYQKIPVSANAFTPAGTTTTGLGSFAATSVIASGSTAYITTGNTGGLYMIPGLAGVPQTYIPLDDARWVDYNSSYVAVLQGTPGRLSVFDKTTLAPVRTISFTGNAIPESKSAFKIVGNKALVAAGLGGVKIYNLATGTLLGSIARPVVAGLDSTVCVANAVTGSGNSIFVSNGEAGVYMTQTLLGLETLTGETILNLSVGNKLKFANLQSVNHVASTLGVLVVAAGTGGVKIITIL